MFTRRHCCCRNCNDKIESAVKVTRSGREKDKVEGKVALSSHATMMCAVATAVSAITANKYGRMGE